MSMDKVKAEREAEMRDKLPELMQMVDAVRGGDKVAAFDDDVFGRLKDLYPSDIQAWSWVRGVLVECKVQPIAEWERRAKPAGGDGDGGTTQAGRLIEIAGTCALLHEDEMSFVDIECDDHRETWPVRSSGCRRWLRFSYLDKYGSAPNNEALGTAIETIDAVAQRQGDPVKVFRRVAAFDGRRYLDLGDEQWQAIEVDSAGWRIVDRPSARFVRSRTMREIPPPLSDGSLEVLRSYLNLSDEDFVLAVAWILAALGSDGPYPVLVLTGEQGSAKSTCARILRSLVDPHHAPLRSVPREERDLFISARNAHVLAFDNLSAVSSWLSDALCRISTGGGYASRELYSDADEIVIDVVRPIILNGIDDVVVRGDLADRALFLTLAPIPDSDRKPEADVLADFDDARPRILGALLDAVAVGLRRLPSVELDQLPRMADFARWVVACEPAVFEPGTFMQAYMHNRSETVSSVIEANPVSSAIRDFMQPRAEAWEGTPSELYSALCEVVDDRVSRSRTWPANAQVLSRNLNRYSSALRPLGINIDKGHRGDKRSIRISPPADYRCEIASNASSSVNRGGNGGVSVTRSDAIDAIDAIPRALSVSPGVQLPKQLPDAETAGEAYRRRRDGE